MKKAINITLGGQVFVIEQTAFDILEMYIGAIKNSLSEADDVLEIVSDIETALAEKFIELGRSEKMAVTEADVAVAKEQMGAPAEFGSGAEEASEKTTKTAGAETKKRLYRDNDDSVIAGVASGIAQYFDIDPVIVRIIFVIATFFNGLGVLAYIILWLVVPEASTTTEKYAMRGEKVTLKEITERVKKNLQDVENKIEREEKNSWNGIRGFFEKLFSIVGTLIRVFVKILRYVIGLALVISGALSIAGLVTAYSVVLLSDKVLMPADVQTTLEILLSNPIGIIAVSASFVMMIIPFLVLVMAGGSLVAAKNLFTTPKSITLAVVWIVAMVMAFTTSALQVEQVMQEIGTVEIEDRSYNIYVNTDEGGAEISIEEVVEEEGEASLSPDVPVIDLPNLEE